MKSGFKKKVAPDGGFYSWVCTFAVSLINLATRSIEPSFGLLFGDLLNSLDVGTTGASIVISLLDVMMNFSGLFVGPLLKEYSYRKVAIGGALLCFIGLALTSFADNMGHLLATYSIINGIGVGFATSSAFVALNHYFSQRRGQAVGLSMAGTALGMLIMPQLVQFLLELYGFRGAVLLISGLALHSLVGAVLLQPIKWHWKEENVDVELVEVEYDGPTMGTIEETEADEDSLPEIKTLLFPNNKKINRQISDPGHNSSPAARKQQISRITTNVSFTNSSPLNGLSKRPTFPRITSSTELSNELRKRKISVISNLSQFDFSGSALQVHVDTGDRELEEESDLLRRVNTHLGMMMSTNKESFAQLSEKIYSGIELGKLEGTDDIDSKSKQSFCSRLLELMDIALLYDPLFINLLFGLSIFYVAEMNFKMITPFFLANLGYDKSDVAFCLSVSALTDILARIIFPPIFDRLKIAKRQIFTISIFFVALTRSILAEQTEWVSILTVLSISGFFRGIALSNFTLTVSEFVSLEKLPAAFGFHMIGKAIFVIAFGPLIGAIRDWTNSFPICIHSQSVCILICILAWVIEMVIRRIKYPPTPQITMTVDT